MRIKSLYSFTSEGLKRLAQDVLNDVRDILNGRLDCTASVTLTANQATTVVTDHRVGRDSVIVFMPLTANAATELYGATMYVKASDIVTTTDPPTFTINHANNAQTDRDFRYAILGKELS